MGNGNILINHGKNCKVYLFIVVYCNNVVERCNPTIKIISIEVLKLQS